MSRVVAGIQDLAWQGLLSEQDAMMFTARVRQLAAAVESGAEPGCVPMEN